MAPIQYAYMDEDGATRSRIRSGKARTSEIRWRRQMSAFDPLPTSSHACIVPIMITLSRLMIALAGALFLAACAYVGYANELLKDAVSPWHRAVLMVGFLLGATAVSRWIMVVDIKRNMRRIRRARSKRGNVS